MGILEVGRGAENVSMAVRIIFSMGKVYSYSIFFFFFLWGTIFKGFGDRFFKLYMYSCCEYLVLSRVYCWKFVDLINYKFYIAIKSENFGDIPRYSIQ